MKCRLILVALKPLYFPDFEDYAEPFEDEGMSEEEEDY